MHEPLDRTATHGPPDARLTRIERAFLDGADGLSQRDLLLLWELRAHASSRTQGSVSLDGGARVEELDPGSPGVRRARFAVGAGPRAVASLARGVLEADEDGWREAAAALTARVSRAHRAASRAGEAAAGAREGRLPDDARPLLAVETRARLRGISGGPHADARLGCEGSLRFVARSPRRGRPLAETVLPGLEHPEGALRSAARSLILRAVAALSVSGVPEASPPPAGTGPVLLAPAAAAWWVHEMAHAAFEGIGGDDGAARGAIIREVPADAPWPAGFQSDDSGAPARASVLWGGRGDAALDAGHRRRSSIRDRAVAGPAGTRLVGRPGSAASMVEMPEGTLAVTSVRAGRLDPPSATILLHADRLAIVRGGSLRPCAGEGVVMVGVEQGWQGLSVVRDGPPRTVISALCTRQGRSCPVMVGAPTLILDSVRFMAT